MVVPFIGTFYPILSAHLPVYSQGYLVMALLVLSLWASLLHPQTICLTVSVEFRYSLHSGVSEVLSVLCLIEFVLKACSWADRIKPFVSLFKKPLLSHLQELSPATSAVCRTNSPCRAFSFQFLIFSCLLYWYSWRISSSSNTFSFKAAWSIHSVVSLRWRCRDLLSFLTQSSVLISPLPPSFLSRYSLAILLLVCLHPFIAKIFLVLLSMLTSSSTVQSTIPAL